MDNSNYSKNFDWRVIVLDIFPRKAFGDTNDAIMTVPCLTEDPYPLHTSEYAHPVTRLHVIPTDTNDILGCHKEVLDVRTPKTVEIGIARVFSP
jgi:hypothetical protein